MLNHKSFFIRAITALGLVWAGQSHAQIIENNGNETRIEETSMTMQQAQDSMDPLRLIEAYLVDKDGPRNERGGWGERGRNIYQVGQQIDAVIYLANVGKYNPGQPDNPQEMELSIIIRDTLGNVIYDVPNVHTFRGVRRIDDPLQEDYFRDRFTVSARVPEEGEYDVGFVFLDKTRPPEKQVPLEVKLRVAIEAAAVLPELTDLTEMIMNEGGDQSYFLRRCAAYFLAQVQIAGRDAFTDEQHAQQNAKIQYFLNADAVISAAANDVTFDQALDTAFAGMEAIADQYASRMVQNYEAGRHPWTEDRMLLRDAMSCTIVYDKREVEIERE